MLSEKLKKTSLFSGLEESDIRKIIRESKSTIMDVAKDEFIFVAGKSVPQMGILLSGEAHVQRETFTGECVIIEILKENDLFGETYTFLGTEKIPVSLKASQNSRVLILDMASLLEHCKRYTKLIQNMLYMMAQKNIVLNTKMSYITHKSIRAKLEAYLYDQAAKNDSFSFQIPFSLTDLADYLCIDRSAMSRELGKMKKEGLLDYKKNYFILA